MITLIVGKKTIKFGLVDLAALILLAVGSAVFLFNSSLNRVSLDSGPHCPAARPIAVSLEVKKYIDAKVAQFRPDGETDRFAYRKLNARIEKLTAQANDQGMELERQKHVATNLSEFNRLLRLEKTNRFSRLKRVRENEALLFTQRVLRECAPPNMESKCSK